MLISLDKNIALLAMTKTGSTALEQAVVPHCDIMFTRNPQVKHMQLRRFERFIRPYLTEIGHDGIETACLFREPISWLGSWYRYRKREELIGHPNSTSQVSFDDFIRAYLSQDPPAFARIGRQSEFVKSNSALVGVAHLYKYENSAAYVSMLEERFDRKLRLTRENVSPKQRLSLDPELEKRLRLEMAVDFEIHSDVAQ